MELADVIKLNNRAQNEIQYLLCEYIKKNVPKMLSNKSMHYNMLMQY
ncbi:hypothetical protein QOK74_08140 [Staphylococcus saprophyticus]|nr:hypothetical protein [Staphylococcus saprophyticus]